MLDFEKVLVVFEHGIRKAGQFGDENLVPLLIGITDAQAGPLEDDSFAGPIALCGDGQTDTERRDQGEATNNVHEADSQTYKEAVPGVLYGAAAYSALIAFPACRYNR